MIPNDESSSAKLSFADIRQYFDEIIFADKKSLSPVDKIVALGILHFVNRRSGNTYVDLLTVAQWTGIEHPAVTASVKRLVADRRFSVRPRQGRTPLLTPVLRNDPIRHSTKGSKEFYTARGDLMELIVSDRDLTAGERLVALGLVATADTEWCSSIGQKELAKRIGVSRVTVNKAIQELIDHGFFLGVTTVIGDKQQIIIAAQPQLRIEHESKRLKKAEQNQQTGHASALQLHSTCKAFADATARSNEIKHLEPKLVDQPDENSEGGVKWGVKWGVNLMSQKARQTGTSTDNLVNPFNLPTPSESAPAAARHEQPHRICLSRDECERFYQLVGLLGNCSRGTFRKTIAGIMVVSGAAGECKGRGVGDEYDEPPFHPDEIQKFVRAGLLARDGDRISITKFGWRAHDEIEQHDRRAAA